MRIVTADAVEWKPIEITHITTAEANIDNKRLQMYTLYSP